MCRLGRKEAHRRGLTRRLRRGVGLAVSWGSRQLWCPKVSKGERREAGIQWIQPPKAVSDPEFRQTTSGAHGSAGRADCLPRGKPPACSSTRQLCCKKSPRRGLTRRLRRGWWGCRPEGGSTFFRSERKYQRKPAARRLQRRPAPLRVAGFGLRKPFGLSSTSVRCAHPPGKSPLLPIFERGSSQCRAQHTWTANMDVRARSCSL